MTTSETETVSVSMNDPDYIQPSDKGGAVADSLTALRILVTPVIMGLIIWRWPDTQVAIFASLLFIIGALTDIFDDFFGGRSESAVRRYGYLDDLADTILIIGSLIALSVVLIRNGMIGLGFFIPVLIIIGRELIIGVAKGYELARDGWPDNGWSNAKGAFAMLGVALLVASPWLTQWIDMSRATGQSVFEVYNSASPIVWIIGQIALWIAAILSVLTAIQIFRTSST